MLLIGSPVWGLYPNAYPTFLKLLQCLDAWHKFIQRFAWRGRRIVCTSQLLLICYQSNWEVSSPRAFTHFFTIKTLFQWLFVNTVVSQVLETLTQNKTRPSLWQCELYSAGEQRAGCEVSGAKAQADTCAWKGSKAQVEEDYFGGLSGLQSEPNSEHPHFSLEATMPELLSSKHSRFIFTSNCHANNLIIGDVLKLRSYPTSITFTTVLGTQRLKLK